MLTEFRAVGKLRVYLCTRLIAYVTPHNIHKAQIYSALASTQSTRAVQHEAFDPIRRAVARCEKGKDNFTITENVGLVWMPCQETEAASGYFLSKTLSLYTGSLHITVRLCSDMAEPPLLCRWCNRCLIGSV